MAKFTELKQKLRQMGINELEAELLTLRKSQFDDRLKRANGSLDKTHQVKALRRNIARIKTLMTEKAGETHVNS